MHTEFRILEVRRGHVWAQPLDAVKRESLRIASAPKYVENEVIVAEPLSDGPGVPPRWKRTCTGTRRRSSEGGNPHFLGCRDNA